MRDGVSRNDDVARRAIRSALMGATWSIVSAFPIAGFIALVFRFPVPFAGYVSGIEAVIPAMLAVIFYGIVMQGLILVGVLGAISGVVTAKLMGPAAQHQRRAVRLVSLAITTFCLFILAILDKIIGPW